MNPEKKVEETAVASAPAVASTASEPSKKLDEKAKTNFKLFLYGMGGFVLLAFVVVFCITLFRVYSGNKTDKFTVTVAKILRLPAAKVNDTRILYSDYAEDMKAIQQMRDYDMVNGGPSADLTDEKMGEQVLIRLANNALIEKAAKKYGLKVVQEEVDAIKEQILAQFKDEEEANIELLNRYGWDLNTYIKKVVKSYILQQNLSQALIADPDIRIEVFNRATAVLERIKAGEDFATLAKEFGEDSSKDNGGDLSWFGKGDMVPQFEVAAFALKKGELSPELVETEFGYHIIRLDDRKTENGVELVKVRHIIFRFPTLEQYLTDMAKTAVVHLYINVPDPFEKMRESLSATSTVEE